MVGADAVIDGPINLREGIIIYGTVKGPVNTNGPVRVAENGNVHGNIIGSDIRIGVLRESRTRKLSRCKSESTVSETTIAVESPIRFS